MTPSSSGNPADSDPPADRPVQRPGEVQLVRTLHDPLSVLVTSGDFGPLFAAWERHAELWQEAPDSLSTVLMRQGLAAATLHLANRPRDEVVAWTLNLRQPPTNVFLTGEARQGIVTGRVYTEGVRTYETSRFYVQTIRGHREPVVSAIEVEGFDLLDIFEQYYERSEQSPARFFEGDGDRFLMVLGLPGVDRQWLEALDPRAAAEIDGSQRTLEERAFRLECGCSPAKMLRALRTIFAEQPEELFQGDERVETSCPRCGRRWWVTREQFEASASGGEGTAEA